MGITVGEGDGSCEGRTDGTADGKVVGHGVGAPGVNVGLLVGRVDGSGVGCLVLRKATDLTVPEHWSEL